jgi:DNA-binding protein YbaB
MFNKLKQIKDLRSQAKTMQSALAQEVVSETSHGITITMDGNMEVKAVQVSEEAKKNLDENIKTAINDTIKKAQRAMAKKMQEMGNLPGLGDLMK